MQIYTEMKLNVLPLMEVPQGSNALYSKLREIHPPSKKMMRGWQISRLSRDTLSRTGQRRL